MPEPLQINVDNVLRQRLPRHYRYIPRFLINWLSHTICQDQLNDLLSRHGDKSATDFADAMLHDLNVVVEVTGEENIPTDTSRLLFVSNHPLGGLDGVAYISLLGNRYKGHFHFMVNDLLMAIPPLREVFLPVNKHGRQSRQYARIIEHAMNSDDAVATFPAGLCSRNTHGRVIEDLGWKKSFVDDARRYGRTIVPMYFDGHNSRFFYRFARWRRKLGIKFNIEMMLLPREMFKARGSRFAIRFGQPIAVDSLDDSLPPMQWAAEIRRRVYALAPEKR